MWKTRSVENAECGECGVWKTRSVENKSLNNDILNNDKFIDQTYTLIRRIQRIGLNDDGFDLDTILKPSFHEFSQITSTVLPTFKRQAFIKV